MDWTKPYSVSYEHWTVNPGTWQDVERLSCVLEATVTFDRDQDTLGDASYTLTEPLDEQYVRTYLVAEQSGSRERCALGTWLLQCPFKDFDGKQRSARCDAYTPLLELSDDFPEIGYTAVEGTDALSLAQSILLEHCRAPFIECDEEAFLEDDFVAELEDTWLTFLTSMLEEVGYRLSLDDLSRVVIEEEPEAASSKTLWEYTDGNSSILCADVTDEADLHEIPNVYQVVYSNDSLTLSGTAINDDPDSIVSTVSRGRRVMQRDTSPDVTGTPDQATISALAEKGLREASMCDRTLTYTHGFNGVVPFGCVHLSYDRAGIDSKALVKSQSIACDSACSVEETAVYKERLWF